MGATVSIADRTSSSSIYDAVKDRITVFVKDRITEYQTNRMQRAAHRELRSLVEIEMQGDKARYSVMLPSTVSIRELTRILPARPATYEEKHFDATPTDTYFDAPSLVCNYVVGEPRRVKLINMQASDLDKHKLLYKVAGVVMPKVQKQEQLVS